MQKGFGHRCERLAPQGTDVSIRPPRVSTLAKGPHLSGYSKGEHLVLGKSIAHDMKSGAEGAHFFGALLLTFSFDKHISVPFTIMECISFPTVK